MNYIRTAALGLALVYPNEVSDQADIESSEVRTNQIPETGEFHERMFNVLVDTLQENIRESNRLKRQQELEDDFWGDANELCDELNSLGFNAVVYEGRAPKGISYAYVQFKLMNSIYWIGLPDPENIKPEFKYNFVFFIDKQVSYVAGNKMDEVMDQIHARINNSLLIRD